MTKAKAVTGINETSSPVWVKFNEGIIPFVGDIFAVGEVYYELRADGFWHVLETPVESWKDITWRPRHTQTMGSVSQVDPHLVDYANDMFLIPVTLFDLTEKSIKMIKNMWPDATYDNDGTFLVPVEGLTKDDEIRERKQALYYAACDFLGMPRGEPFCQEHISVEEVAANMGLPEVTTGTPMPPVKACKPEEGEVTYSANAPDKSMEFRMGGATIAQIENVLRIFPNMEHRGDGYFVISLPSLGAIGKYPDPEVREQYASTIYRGVCDIMNDAAPGHSAKEPAPTVTEERPIRPHQNFLTDPLPIPPRPGSHENDRQLAIRGALGTHQAHISVEKAIRSLGGHIEGLDLTQGEALKNPAIMALAALKRVKDQNKRRKIRRITSWIVGLALLAGAGYGATEYVKKNVVSSHYTTITECKVPFGDDELEGKRLRTYTYKSLLGYRFGSNNDISVERVEVKLPGSELTILGRDDEKAKPWRMTYAKGDYGTAILKPSAQYWFVGSNDRTTLVNNTDFCH